MSDLSVYVGDLREGASIVFCQRVCARYWATEGPGRETGEAELAGTVAGMHCGWCGNVIYVPEHCFAESHDDGCPAHRWELTFAGLAVVRVVLGRAGTKHLPDAAFPLLEETWEKFDPNLD